MLRFARPVRWRWRCCGGDAPSSRGGRRARPAAPLRGHRFVGGAVEVSAAAEDYVETLRAAVVVADQRSGADDHRRAWTTQLRAGGWSDPAGVLDEVVDLGEWPTVLRGSIRASYLTAARRG